MTVKRIKSFICMFALMGGVLSVMAVDEISEDFSRFRLGAYEDAAFAGYWPQVKWAHLYGKLSVVEGDSGHCLHVRYPKGGVGPEETGSQFVLNLPPKDEYELSYRVKFEEGFDFRLGGKLPGLTSGGGKFTGGHHPTEGQGWSARFMWRKGGAVELYLYYIDNKGKWGDQHSFEGITLKPGEWYTLRQRIRLNDPDQKNGRIQAWVNDQPVLDLQNIRLRIGDKGPIDSFYFSTFHGGNQPEWGPLNDSVALFDDIRVWSPETSE